jgi:hypothetical protein
MTIMENKKQIAVGNATPDSSESKKCPVMVGEDEQLCHRPGVYVYRTVVVLMDGKRATENLHVCERHREVLEEFLQEQGEHQ